ncbi:unnamed protein product [Larinioides sclopetarius]|uniref:THAP-type domain-containing protein n=1 Tax=Larinioides sclopetarius TaxID=280406 RepID=A0AAV2ADA2_9ARAC
MVNDRSVPYVDAWSRELQTATRCHIVPVDSRHLRCAGRCVLVPLVKRQKKWFTALKWNVPPEKLKYVLYNARVCNRHFFESCFSSTLRRRLNKCACTQINDLPSSASEKLSTLPSSASACSQTTENFKCTG